MSGRAETSATRSGYFEFAIGVVRLLISCPSPRKVGQGVKLFAEGNVSFRAVLYSNWGLGHLLALPVLCFVCSRLRVLDEESTSKDRRL